MIRLLAALLAVLVLAAPAPAGPPRQADLEAEIVCPTCHDTAAQIKAKLVDQFGPAVLAEPPKHGFDLLAWLLPLAALALGAVAVGGLAWTWSRRRDDETGTGEGVELDPDLEQRVDEELARYEG